MRTHAFICGCGHSGTSLMAAMFASHPGAFIPLRETETFLKGEAVAERLAALLAEARAGGRGIEHRRRRNWQVNQTLFDGRGQGKDLLPEDDLAPFATGTARALMTRFGYA